MNGAGNQAAPLARKSEGARDGPAQSALLEVRGLVREYDVSRPWLNRVIEGGERQVLRALRDVSLTVGKGTTFGLVGESGSGKSTLAKLIVGLERPTSGDVLFDGVQVGGRAWAQQRRRVQMVFQDPFASLNPRWRVNDIIAEPIGTFRLRNGRDAIRARVRELLTLVGLDPDDGGKYPHAFSGGQRQRIAIARALASEADFLVCDEPTSALDVSVQAQVLNLMRELQVKLGLTYLLISHDLAVVRHMADRIGVMYLGRIVETAPKTELFAAPQHPYTKLLLGAVPNLEALDDSERAIERHAIGGEIPSPINPPPGCAFHPRCPLRFEPCDGNEPELKASGDARQVACFTVEKGAAG